MITRMMTFVNRTKFDSGELKKIAGELIAGRDLPCFYLVAQTPQHIAVTISKLDKPAILITVFNLAQFKQCLAHELEHLRQHREGYTNEEEARKAAREVVVSEG